MCAESGVFGVPLVTLLDQDQRRTAGTKVPFILQRVSERASRSHGLSWMKLKSSRCPHSVACQRERIQLQPFPPQMFFWSFSFILCQKSTRDPRSSLNHNRASIWALNVLGSHFLFFWALWGRLSISYWRGLNWFISWYSNSANPTATLRLLFVHFKNSLTNTPVNIPAFYLKLKQELVSIKICTHFYAQPPGSFNTAW